MREKDITYKVKDFVLEELRQAMDYPNDALTNRNIAFGAVFFSTNNLYAEYNKELADWWENDILPLFNTIIKRGY